MGYHRYGRRQDWRGTDRGPDAERRPRMSRPPEYDYDDRNLIERIGDEVRAWFGDTEAERRRDYDQYMDRRFSADFINRRMTGMPNDPQTYAPHDAMGGSGTDMGYGLVNGDRDRPAFDRRDRFAEDYEAWRNRKIEEFDRDYDEFRREKFDRFDRDFTAWRKKRYEQRLAVGTVKEHQEVVGSDGEHVGTVDYIRGGDIVLTKKDDNAGGHHHAVPSSWIADVDKKVVLNRTADEALEEWRDVEARKAFFEPDYESDDPKIGNRSFAREPIG